MILELLERIDCLERVVVTQAQEISFIRSELAQRDGEIKRLNGIIAEQAEKMKKLELQLKLTSKNSSKPPSTDPPWKKEKPKTDNGATLKIGAQKGHGGIARVMVPIEEVSEIITCKPAERCDCGGPIEIEESPCERKQVHEIPQIKSHVMEYQVFKGCCRVCSAKVRGTLPEGVPSGMLGINALATIALLTGKYHLSKRDVSELLNDCFGLSICIGTVCNAEHQVSEGLKIPYEEAAASIQTAAVVRADETSHSVSGKRFWMWVGLTLLVSVFFARATRSKKVAQEILGEEFSGILISDRYNAYLWVGNRQLCWAHLIRDFNKLVDAGGQASEFAKPILEYIKEMFSLWHDFTDGKLDRPTLQKRVKPSCDAIEQCLEHGKSVPLCEALSKSLCDLKHALWTFIYHNGVEPTNNQAEGTVRKYVIWRKTSFGTQSTKGNEFVERILTVVETCRRQGRNVLDYLKQAVAAHLVGTPSPTLLPEMNL